MEKKLKKKISVIKKIKFPIILAQCESLPLIPEIQTVLLWMSDWAPFLL